MHRRQHGLLAALCLLGTCLGCRAGQLQPRSLLQPGRGLDAGHIGLIPSTLGQLQHSRSLLQTAPARQAPAPAPQQTPASSVPTIAVTHRTSTTASGFAFNITSNRTALLQQAGTLGSSVPGNTSVLSSYFQATVPSTVSRASLMQLPSGQGISVNQKPPGLLQQFDGNSITDTVAAVNLPIEPPNPAICVGNGFVVEVTNLALSVFSAQNGTRLGGPVGLPAFFGVEGPPTNGLSDPYCVYDGADSQRFFVTIQFFTCLTMHPNCSANPVFNYLLIASSRTSNPLEGFQGPFYVDTSGVTPQTLQPYPGFEACKPAGALSPGCFGDYPTIGLNDDALWFGINLFTRIPLSAGTVFVGALVYGVRKYDLVNGGRTYPPYALYYSWGDLPGFTVVPAVQQNGGNLPLNGTQFLVSSDLFTFSGIADATDGIPSLRTWAITHTERISEGFPGGLLPDISPPTVLLTETLQYPTVEFYDYDEHTSVISQPSGRYLDARDERLRQVSLAEGLLWTTLVTAISIDGVSVDAAAYFVIQPSFSSAGVYAPSLISQGYVGTCGNSIIDPSITATADRTAVMTGSIVGNGYYLSPFYTTISMTRGVGQIIVPHLSSSELIATGYQALAPLRTGDYSTATLDELGNVWLVAEYASSKNASATSGSGGPNAPVIGLNWGTWIMQLDASIS